MANFLLYKYKFEKTSTRSLFSTTDGETVSEELLSKRLDDALKSAYTSSRTNQLNLYSTVKNRKGETEPENYANTIKNNVDGVTLISIKYNRIKKIMPIDSNNEQKVGHYPSCYVIIDSRPDSTAILVQQNNAFPSADFVIDIIESCISRMLNLVDLNWKIKTEKRICSGRIWDIVRARTAGGHDRVRTVSYKFNDKREPNKDCPVDVALRFVLTQLASPEGELKLTSDDPTKKLLDETMPDVVNIVDLLIENEYRIIVGFCKSGSIEYGKNADAVYGIEDRFCEDFGIDHRGISDDGKQIFEMIIWLDKLMPDDTHHEYAPHLNRRKKNNYVG